MGNALGRIVNPETLDESLSIDGGRAYLPIRQAQRQTISVSANGMTTITRPNGPEYDPKIVAKLIMARRLAPCYAGNAELREESEAESSSESSVLAATNNSSVPSEGALANRDKDRKKRKRGFLRKLSFSRSKPRHKKTSPSNTQVDEYWLLHQLVECPICYLNYPRNINYAKCCKKPICTKCFINLRRPSSGRYISCPFCNATNFTVLYMPPKRIMQLEEEMRLQDNLDAEQTLPLDEQDLSEPKVPIGSKGRKLTSAEAIRAYHPLAMPSSYMSRYYGQPNRTLYPYSTPPFTTTSQNRRYYEYRPNPVQYYTNNHASPPASNTIPTESSNQSTARAQFPRYYVRPYESGTSNNSQLGWQQPNQSRYALYGARYHGGGNFPQPNSAYEDSLVREAIRRSLVER